MGKAPAKSKTAAKGGKGRAAKGAAAAAVDRGPLISPTNRLILIITGLALVPFTLPTLLLLLVGMLPTIAALFLERGTAKQGWISVGGLNFAGLSNWMLNLWFAHHTFSYAIEELLTITPLLVSYASAAVGWGLYLAMPPLVNAVTTVTYQRRVIALSAQQRKLVEQWGDGVVSRNGTAKPAEPPAPQPSPAAARGRA